DPTPGTVSDGLDQDITWTNNDSSLSANWTGFSDATSGIGNYEYAIGSSAGGQNIVAWTNADSATEVTHEGLVLNHGTTYYFSVRGLDQVDHVSDPANSNGATVDTIPPVVTLIAEEVAEDPTFQGSDSSVTLVWEASDALSGVEHYEYALGTTAGDMDLVAWVHAGTDLTVTIPGLVLAEGETYFGSVRVFDLAGNVAEGQGDGVTVDITAPAAGTAMDITDLNNTADQSFTGSTTTLQASWSGFSDNMSGINTYEYAVGSTALQTDIKSWTSAGPEVSMTDDTFSLVNEQAYFVSVRAVDAVGNISVPVSTDGIIADHAGPIGFTVADGDSMDIDRQNFTDVFSGHWGLFYDAHSGLSFHEAALFDTTSQTYAVPWNAVDLDTVILYTELSLELDHVYQLHVRGVDSVANTGTITSSDGVLIDQSPPDPPQGLLGYFSTERIQLTWDENTETDLSHYIVYGGTDTLQPMTVLQTSETIAEAFLPEFPADQQIYLHITAEDVPGNESLISSRVSGVPQPATVTYIEPSPSGTLLHDDNQLSIHFSQPL
ncbi:MAG: hypothetical protein QGF90_13450, partial [Gammaproteobacteria bacterium]|nr:hypothetical protein [Gammaproteobacteria bacterium]